MSILTPEGVVYSKYAMDRLYLAISTGQLETVRQLIFDFPELLLIQMTFSKDLKWDGIVSLPMEKADSNFIPTGKTSIPDTVPVNFDRYSALYAGYCSGSVEISRLLAACSPRTEYRDYLGLTEEDCHQLYQWVYFGIPLVNQLIREI